MNYLIYNFIKKFLSIHQNELFEFKYYYNIFRIPLILLKIMFLLFLLYFIKVNSFNRNIIIEIDNNFKEMLYENDLDFSNYTTNIKIIAIYYPQYIKKDIIYLNNQNQNECEINNDINIIFNNYKKQGKSVHNEYLINKNDLPDLIKEQVKLAKSHGIYGFGINYYWFSGQVFYNEPINIFSKNKEINYPYFLIWKNDELLYYNNELEKNVIITQKFEKDNLHIFIKDIKNYLLSENYIKINGKPVLAIYEPLIIPNLEDYLYKLRLLANESGIGIIYIIASLNNYEKETYKELFDSFYEFPPKNLDLNEFYKNENFYYYTGLIYRINTKYMNNIINFNIYRGTMLSRNTSTKNQNNPLIFKEYTPEKFYIIIKILIKWTLNHQNENNSFIFINSWNNWKEGSFLEPDEYLGYASLNALSKAIFNISLYNTNYNLTYLNNISKVAVQAHIYYEDLIKDMINKINNIPIKYDLFITTTSIEVKNKINEYITKYSNSNKYEIVILENKGRDILPLLTQLKYKIKQYKYLCHIHSKKSKTSPIIGIQWRNYLYNNLLGNIRIVSEILSDFQNIDKLGFIYPETFYEIIRISFVLTRKTKYYMQYIIKKLFPHTKIGNNLEFPAGNMFWARVTAIYQIFEINFDNKFDNEKDQTNDTIMHGIERIWLYLVKINGFFYKKIFNNSL